MCHVAHGTEDYRSGAAALNYCIILLFYIRASTSLLWTAHDPQRTLWIVKAPSSVQMKHDLLQQRNAVLQIK